MQCTIEWVLSPYLMSGQGISWLLAIVGLVAPVSLFLARFANAVAKGKEGSPQVFLLTMGLFVIISGTALYQFAEYFGPTLKLSGRHCTSPTQEPTEPPTVQTRPGRTGEPHASAPNTPSRPADTHERDVEVSFWNTAIRLDTEDMYRKYLARYPRGEFAELARARMAQIQKAAREVELNRWRAASAENSVAAYNRYLDSHPNGEFAASARAKIAEIQKAAETELNQWRATVAQDTVPAYQRYLGTYPQGRFSADARNRIAQLNAAQSSSGRTSSGGPGTFRDGRARIPGGRPY